MGITKANLQIESLRIDYQDNEMGIEFKFNQPIQLNTKMEPMTDIFIPNKHLCELFKLIRKD